MANYQYLVRGDQNSESSAAVQSYLQAKSINVNGVLEETAPNKIEWHDSVLGNWLNNDAKSGDALIIGGSLELARSSLQMLQVLQSANDKQVSIHFAQYNTCFTPGSATTAKILDLLQLVEAEFSSRRTVDALSRRRAAGLPLGRPKGRKNNSLKLDSRREDIMKYLQLGISKASIAKLVGCHSQTLYDWMERHGIAVSKDVDENGRSAPKIVNKNLRKVFEEVMIEETA